MLINRLFAATINGAPFPFFVTVKVALSPTGIVIRAAILINFLSTWFVLFTLTSSISKATAGPLIKPIVYASWATANLFVMLILFRLHYYRISFLSKRFT